MGELNRVNVSFQDNFYSNLKNRSLYDILEEIKSSKYKEITISLRKHYIDDDGLYGLKKKALPAVTFCANFKNNSRTKENLDFYNSIMILDIDNIGIENREKIIEQLSSDGYIFALWMSPSGNGIKGLVHLKYEDNITPENVDIWHYSAFAKLATYLQEKYEIELDQSGKDFTRLCFLSWDANIFIREENQINYFVIKKDDKLELKRLSKVVINKTGEKLLKKEKNNILNNPWGKNSPTNKRTMQNITRFLVKNKKSITFDYDDWLRVALAIASSFTFEIGLKYFIELSKMDATKFNESNCKSMLEDCYINNKKQISFNTIIHLASQRGFKYGKEIGLESN